MCQGNGKVTAAHPFCVIFYRYYKKDRVKTVKIYVEFERFCV